MAVTEDSRNVIVILENASTALRILGQNIEALRNLGAVREIFEEIKDGLRNKDRMFKDMVEEISKLGGVYQILERETRSHVKTVKQNAQRNMEIFHHFYDKAMEGGDISDYLDQIHRGAKESLESIEMLKPRFDAVIMEVSACIGKAGLEQKHSKDMASNVAKKARIFSGLTVGGGIGAFGAFGALRVGNQCLSAFGPAGAAAGTALSFLSGLFIGAVAGGASGKVVNGLFEEYAEKFQSLEDALNKIDKILADNADILTEIGRLLADLKGISSNAENLKGNYFLRGFQLRNFKKTSDALVESCELYLRQRDVPGEKLLMLFDKNKDNIEQGECDKSIYDGITTD